MPRASASRSAGILDAFPSLGQEDVMNLSRRAFARAAGAGAAAAVFSPLIAVKPLFAVPPPAATGEVRLSANENPYGPSPAALDAMRDAFAKAWRYPDESQDALVEAIAKS